MKNTILKSLLFIGIILIAPTTFGQSKSTKDKKIKVFLLAGQSNMDGRAKAEKLTADDRARLEKATKNVTLYYNHKEPVALQETTVAAHVKKTFGAAQLFGPELFFGIEMSEKYPDHKIILIKRSRGGMSLYGAWNPNWEKEKAATMNEENAPKLYNDFIAYANEVLSSFNKNDYEICGMLWVQGETDSGVKKFGTKAADSYQDNLTALISGVRKEFSLPELPFIMFQVGGGNVVKGMKNIAKNDNYVSLIPQSWDKNSPDYFEKNPPPIYHYTYASMKRIGTLFFDYYQNDYTK